MNLRFATLSVSAALVASAIAEDATTRIQFEAGTSQAVVTGKVTGRDGTIYKLNAKEGQFLLVQVLPEGKGADFNIFIPGKGPGDEALFNSSTGGRTYIGQLYKTGDHSILVYQNRAAARRGETADYKMLVRVTDKKPEPEEVPATGPVPQKVIDDCLAELRKMVGEKEMKVKKAERGENSFIIDVDVEGVPEPWRCFHDGTKCTGTEYQGEG
ncbi:serine/threonine protein kinase [Haloferula helveola]|uniref:Serine/threonine protein kinase n=1 Tax=Haloferula helveola TaxID=490095 RepID=A0ABM7RLJ1_9BACT|nr:serine/threonine protein kinase [Haloferula helveola]